MAPRKRVTDDATSKGKAKVTTEGATSESTNNQRVPRAQTPSRHRCHPQCSLFSIARRPALSDAPRDERANEGTRAAVKS